MESRKEKAVKLFKEGYNCAQSVFAAYSDLYGIDEKTALRLSSSFGAGMGRMREVCGAVSGMFLIAGLETGAIDGKDVSGKKHNYEVVQKLAEIYRKKNGSIICKELLGLDRQITAEQLKDTTPEARTPQYYKKRPCPQLIYNAAEIIETVLLNDNVSFIEVKETKQIEELAAIANEVWHEHFTSILSKAQIDYMVEKFQSISAMTDQIHQQGYRYFFIHANGINMGYIGIREDRADNGNGKNKLFLSKLYLLKPYRKKGYANKAFHFMEKICKEQNLQAIWLTVNRFNEDTILVYKKKGFKIIRTQAADIGSGYIMDDYIMEKNEINYEEEL